MNTSIVRVGVGAFGVSEAASAGWTITRRPYGKGEAGIRQSLEEVCRLMREARLDPDVKGWAVRELTAKGLDGRAHPSIRQQAAALLDAFRAQTIYVPDAAGAEHVQAAHVTLCLRDRCIPGEDCESLVIALGGAMLAIGLPTYGVKVSYGSSHQEHILIGLLDDNENAFYADPSTKYPLMEKIPGAVEEIWVDPLEQIGPVGTGAEIVTLGAPRTDGRELYLQKGIWFEYLYGRWWVLSQGRWAAGPKEKDAYGMPKPGASDTGAACGSCAAPAEGMGKNKYPETFYRSGTWWTSNGQTEVQISDAQARTMGLGAQTVTTTTPYQPVTNGVVHAGLRYRIGMQITFGSDPTSMEQSDISDQFSADWFVESFDDASPANFVPGLNVWEQSFIMQAIAKHDMTLVGSATVSYLVVGVQASSANPLSPGAVVPATPVAPSGSMNVSLLAAGAVAAVAGGVGYSLLRRKKR